MNWVSVKPPILTNQRKKIYYHEKKHQNKYDKMN